uniref:Vacuolar membrane-associated protein Iml1 N-terminal domain-containing protein n=1 Tax=Amphimedon queenslandica TaxID=400682 RepID=A0A1X7TB62_AMPQE
MWRFTNSLIDKGVYISRKLLFAGMLLRVSGLWTKGETVKSGVQGDWLYQEQNSILRHKIKVTTEVASNMLPSIVFRSASLQFFLFMQVSSEIWEFDPNGVIPLINSIKDLEMGIAYWNLIFTGRFKFLDLWCEFLKSRYKEQYPKTLGTFC